MTEAELKLLRSETDKINEEVDSISDDLKKVSTELKDLSAKFDVLLESNKNLQAIVNQTALDVKANSVKVEEINLLKHRLIYVVICLIGVLLGAGVLEVKTLLSLFLSAP